MASLLGDMDQETVTLQDALATLSLPREVGVGKPPLAEEPDELPLLAANGRYGPYLKWGKDTRSIPAGGSPLTFTMEEAIKLYREPKQRGRSAPKILKELGFLAGRASPCNFYHPQRGISMTVHGDDFTSCGKEADLKRLDAQLKARYELKTNVLGPDASRGHLEEIRVLNRVLSWTADGLTYDAD